MSGINDTQPDPARHVTTDPGLGGSGPAVQATGAVDAGKPAGIAQAASPVVRGVTPEPPVIGPDPTPVPPETDGLLSGLIAGENEAYFRKAKPASQSGGAAAAAFAGTPREPVAGSPTPPPEPAVLLRRSVELEAVDPRARAPRAAPAPDADVTPVDAGAPLAGARDTVPRRLRPWAPPDEHDTTVPLPEPRPAWVDKAIAFGVAAVVVGAIGILVLRGGGTSGAPEASAPRSTGVSASSPPAPSPASPPAPPPAEATASPAIPPPPPEAPAAEAPQSDGTQQAAPGRPQVRPRTSPRPRASGSAATQPGEVVPPPKDDVKRSM